MKVLVTGGNGFLGKVVCARLKEGHKVINYDKQINRELETIVGSILNKNELQDAMDGIDVVVHLAGVGGYSKKDSSPNFDDYMNINVVGTACLLESAVVKKKVKRVIIASSICAFGTKPSALPCRETDTPNPGGPGSELYGLSKYLGEILCQGYTTMHGLSTVCLRFAVIKDLRNGTGLGGSAGTLWSYTDVRDAAEAVRLAVEASDLKHEVFFIHGPDSFCPPDENIINGELLRREMPEFVLQKAGKEFLNSHTPFFSIEKAKTILGYRPRYTWRKEQQ